MSKSIHHKVLNLASRMARAVPYRLLDGVYTALDRRNVRRTRNLRLIPSELYRRGGKYAYGEWAHVAGIFQTLMLQHLERPTGAQILDIGCGTGLLAIAAEPFVSDGGHYLGIDVGARDIAFCQHHYPQNAFSFVHLDVANPTYSPDQSHQKARWEVPDDSRDLVTALSVWTHFAEQDAGFYLAEVERVLKPGGKAIVTFFLLDQAYDDSLTRRSPGNGRYHQTDREQWVFDQPVYGSSDWRCPAWAQVPENAIGVTREGLHQITQASGLREIEHYPGNWKEIPGAYFQDIVIFQKETR